ncbi:MAG: hypothetical protein M1497_02145 [Nitrospirae bacterium]|nr:hypothetical protein [Nitrospirota bacterium]
MNSPFKGVYQDSIEKIGSAVEQGMPFDEACSLITVSDTGLREAIINDSLRALIACQHCAKGIPLKQLAMKLRVSLSRLMNARQGMLPETGRTEEDVRVGR